MSGAREAELAQYAEEVGIEDPPPVEVVREVEPREHGAVLRECLTTAGFPPDTPVGDPIAEWNIPEAQAEAFNLADYVCYASYPVKDHPAAAGIDAEQLGLVYDFWLAETIPCLAGLGYQVETPPTREAYLGGVIWDPRASTYEAVMFGCGIGPMER